MQPTAATKKVPRGHYSFEMLDRAVTLLEQVATASGPLGVSALARRTGMPKTSAFRLLATLSDLSLVDRAGNGYRPGQRMRHLVDLVHEQVPYDLRRLTMPYLIELYERTNDVVTLGVIDGNEMVILESIRGHRHATMTEPAERSPAHCSAIGKLLLARDPQATADALHETLRACTSRSILDRTALSAELARIRQTGIAFSDQEHVPGVIEVALPVIDRDGPVAGIARSRRAGTTFDVAGDAVHRQVAFAASTAVRRHAAPRHVPAQPSARARPLV
jgi:IclR family transcriptional regulator, KDG regulon repressor